MPQLPGAPAPHQALYRRWRAQTFAGILGQDAVVESLRNAVRLDRTSHAYLFIGPRGTGKTSMARILAKAVNCLAPVDGEPCDACEPCVSIREGRALDVIELDAASNNGVDDMHELLSRVVTAPADLRRKVFILDEVQRLSGQAWDVLLKPLEEPSGNVLFIFCTTEPSKVKPAIVSRVQRYVFRPLTVSEIEGKLGRILGAEGREAEPEAVTLLAELASGGMRDAESMLDQAFTLGADRLTLALVRDLLGLADVAAVDSFISALLEGDVLAGVAALDGVEAAGRDLGAFADQVVARLRQVLVARLTGTAGPISVAEGMNPDRLAVAARRLGTLDLGRVRPGGQRFQLELALFGAASTAPIPERASREALPVAQAPSPAALPPAAPSPPPSAPSIVPARDSPAPRRPADTGDRDQGALERLRSAWPELVAVVAENPANKPLIAACRPVEVHDRIVILGFPEDQAFLRDIAERKRPALEAGVARVLGDGYGVRCVATNLEAVEPVATEPADVDLVDAFREIFAGEVANVTEIG